MKFEHGAGFRICGAVVRKWVHPAGKCAFLTLATPGRKGEVKHELRAFDGEIVHQIHDLGVGQIVQATGGVDREALKNKAKEDVQVDGRAVWMPALTIRALTVEGSSVKPKEAPAPAGQPVGWDDKDGPDF